MVKSSFLLHLLYKNFLLVLIVLQFRNLFELAKSANVDFLAIAINFLFVIIIILVQVLVTKNLKLVEMSKEGMKIYKSESIPWNKVEKIKMTFFGLYRLRYFDLDDDIHVIFFAPTDLPLLILGLRLNENEMDEIIERMRKKHGFLID